MLGFMLTVTVLLFVYYAPNLFNLMFFDREPAEGKADYITLYCISGWLLGMLFLYLAS